MKIWLSLLRARPRVGHFILINVGSPPSHPLFYCSLPPPFNKRLLSTPALLFPHHTPPSYQFAHVLIHPHYCHDPPPQVKKVQPSRVWQHDQSKPFGYSLPAMYIRITCVRIQIFQFKLYSFHYRFALTDKNKVYTFVGLATANSIALSNLYVRPLYSTSSHIKR